MSAFHLAIKFAWWFTMWLVTVAFMAMSFSVAWHGVDTIEAFLWLAIGLCFLCWAAAVFAKVEPLRIGLRNLLIVRNQTIYGDAQFSEFLGPYNSEKGLWG